MSKIVTYTNFKVNEGVLSAISIFLKSNFNRIFQDPNQNLNNLFVDFSKKIDKDRNVSNLYQRYVRTSQNIIQTQINSSETIDAINKLVTDEIKYFYFSLKPVVNKLQHDEFTMEKIFERSKDKRLQALMSYTEDKFSNSVTQYVSDSVVPWIKKDAGLEQTNQEKQQTQQPQQTTERIRYNVSKILESDEIPEQNTNEAPAQNTKNDAEKLLDYKKSSIKWINLSLFELLKPKFQFLNQLGATTSSPIDQLSKQMKGTTNDNAKKMILNNIVNMNKDELQNLANTLGLKQEEIGKL